MKKGDKMEENGKSKKVAYAIIAGMLLLLIIVEHFVSHYSDIDNYYISVIINGVYSDEHNFVLFLHPILSFIIKALHGLLPTADWYLIITEFSVLFACFSLSAGWAIYEKYDIKKTGLFCFALFLFVVGTDAVHANFTITTGIINCIAVAVCVFWMLTGKKKLLIFSCALYATSWLYRSDSCELLIPYLLLVFGYAAFRGIREKDALLKKNAFKGGLLLLSIGILMFAGRLIYINHSEYKEGSKYNQARAQIADYYDDGHRVMHILMDTDGVDEEYLINWYETEFKTRESDKKLYLEICRLPYRILKLGYTTLFFACAVFLVLYSYVSERKVINLVTVGLALLGSEIMFTFFGMKSRGIERVAAVIMLGVLLTGATCFLFEQQKENKKLKSVLLIIYSALCVLYMFRGNIFCAPQNAFTALKDNECDVAKEIGYDNTVFVWNVYHLDQEILEKEFYPKGKLYSREFAAKNIADGEWSYGQPYYEDFLEETGVYNPMKRLFEEDNYLYIAKTPVAEQVKEYYDKNDEYEIVIVGYFEGDIPINQFRKK